VVDPRERLNAAEVLHHKWMHLGTTEEQDGEELSEDGYDGV
jgi:hypothetical protein